MDDATESNKTRHQGHVDPAAAREQALLKKIMGVSNQKTLMQSATKFFVSKEEEVEEKSVHAEDSIRKIKNCSVCKVQKINHLMREFNNNQPGNDNSQINSPNFGLNED
jgi:hypothetical protein